MDITGQPQMLPRWAGIVLGLILPGSAHFLSGKRKTGLIWFLALLLCGFIGHAWAAIPAKPMVVAGLGLNFLVLPLLYLTMLCTSFRPVPRLRGPGWILFAAVLIGSNLLSDLMLGRLAPAKPFRVPTGAMQPTIRGVRFTGEIAQTSTRDLLVEGKRYREFRAMASGYIKPGSLYDNSFTFTIEDVPHEIPSEAIAHLNVRKQFTEGEIIAAGTSYAGDHIVVERVSYMFGEPGRGDIIVFRTSEIDHPDVSKDTVYVKRVAGLPGETIQINPPHLLANQLIIKEPAIFEELQYGNGGRLASPADSITLKDNEYLVLGDNSKPGMSLDGRFYGPIPRSSIIGRVSTIYWPLNRIGPVR